MALYEGLYFTYMDWKFTETLPADNIGPKEPKSVLDQCNHFVLSHEHIKLRNVAIEKVPKKGG